jgi:hypothetical protein
VKFHTADERAPRVQVGQLHLGFWANREDPFVFDDQHAAGQQGSWQDHSAAKDDPRHGKLTQSAREFVFVRLRRQEASSSGATRGNGPWWSQFSQTLQSKGPKSACYPVCMASHRPYRPASLQREGPATAATVRRSSLYEPVLPALVGLETPAHLMEPRVCSRTI